MFWSKKSSSLSNEKYFDILKKFRKKYPNIELKNTKNIYKLFLNGKINTEEDIYKIVVK